MIVVFRRIKAAAGRVTGTEWVLVLVEGLLVFLGIFAAFQLQEWADARREAKARHDLMERLTVEAESNVRFLREQRDGYDREIELVSEPIEEWVRTDRCPDANISIIGQIPTLQDKTVVYDEMIGAGGLALLPDDTVRKAIADYHAMRKFYVGQQELMRDTQAQVPLVQYLMDIGFEASVGEEGQVGIVRNPARSCDDMRAKTAIVANTMFFVRLHQWRTVLADRAIEKCAVLANRVGRQCTPDPDEPLEGKDLETARKALES